MIQTRERLGSTGEPDDNLSRYLNRGLYFCAEIRAKYPSMWLAVAEAIARSNEMLHRVSEDRAALSIGNPDHVLGMWGSVRRYQIASILEIFSRNLDEGLAILRMAAELVRVVKTVAANPGLYSAWIGGKPLRTKFDLNDSAEKAVFDTYKFCSNYGTHGHKTSTSYLEDTFMGKEPSLKGVATVAGQWFVSFAPMHRVCLTSSVPAGTDLLLECDLSLTAVTLQLLERVQNDHFFRHAT